ncbi:MAG: major capsid protein [Kiloniellales bacterium]
MATLATTNPTLLDHTSRMDPDGSIAQIVEILNEQNEVLQDLTFLEGNLPTGHRSTIRSGLPQPTWRKLYGGVQPTKSQTVQVTDNAGNLEAYAEVDKDLADLNGNTAAFRMSEDRAHIEGMNQTMADTIFYGDEDVYPERFTGLAPRFNDGAPARAANAENILNGLGAGSDNASIWLVVWGPNTCHMFYPKGSTVGLQVNNKGQVTIEDVDGQNGRMEAYRTHYKWGAGMVVRDWRYVSRACNVDKSDLSALFTPGTGFASGADLPDLMHSMITRIPNLRSGRPVFYMNRTLLEFLGKQVSAKTQGSTLTTENVGGQMVMSFLGIPIRRSDALAGDEAAVPFS